MEEKSNKNMKKIICGLLFILYVFLIAGFLYYSFDALRGAIHAQSFDLKFLIITLVMFLLPIILLVMGLIQIVKLFLGGSSTVFKILIIVLTPPIAICIPIALLGYGFTHAAW